MKQKDGLRLIDVVMRNYEPGNAFLHAQQLRNRYGRNVKITYSIKNKVPIFNFRLTLVKKEAVPCQPT
ncbi:hypothetical protein BML2531_43700 (plasmid) [Providencia rettgeri]|nr:hypothetical protein BML2531_43700 [Providencia rettgeri]